MGSLGETKPISNVILEIDGNVYEFTGGGGSQPGPNTVGTEELKDGAVETQDLNQDVIDRMTHSYDAEGEGIRIGGFAQEASTAPTVPTQPMDVEEEEEP